MDRVKSFMPVAAVCCLITLSGFVPEAQADLLQYWPFDDGATNAASDTAQNAIIGARRGWRLRPFRQDDLQAFIEVREVLELKALELARPKLDAGELQRMLDLNVPSSSAETSLVVDESLHEYLISTAGNAYIRDFFDRQGRYYRLLFEWEDLDDAVAIETMRQHRQILTALLEKKWSAARKALSHHILDNHPILSQVEGISEREE